MTWVTGPEIARHVLLIEDAARVVHRLDDSLASLHAEVNLDHRMTAMVDMLHKAACGCHGGMLPASKRVIETRALKYLAAKRRAAGLRDAEFHAFVVSVFPEEHADVWAALRLAMK